MAYFNALLILLSCMLAAVAQAQHVQQDADERVVKRASPSIIGCPFEVNDRPSANRITLQIIEHTYYKWEEHDLDDGRLCLVLLRPEQLGLSAEQASELLERSARWVEEIPSTARQELRSPDERLLNAPPARQPIPRSPHSPLFSRPDAEAAPDHDSVTVPLPALQSGTTPQAIFGVDDREEVENTTRFPWWVIGFQAHAYASGDAFRCTAFLVGPYLALTAGHCIYNPDLGGFANEVVFAPAQYQPAGSSQVVQPFGMHNACLWVTNQPFVDTSDLPFDYAALFFRDAFTSLGIGTFMPLVFDRMPATVNTAGYPATAQGRASFGMWYAFEEQFVQVDARLLLHRAATTAGQSGSPMWEFFPDTGARRVVALNTFGSQNFNGGPRLVAQNLALIESWMSEQATACATQDVEFSGRVTSTAGVPLCAMVLINGQFMFSCDGNGNYRLTVPLDSEGRATVFTFADGFEPFRRVVTPATHAVSFNIVARAAGMVASPNVTLTQVLPSGTRVTLRGRVTNAASTPLCAMVLANGEHMFSCNGQGLFDLNVPRASDGSITLFAFADGFRPFRLTFIP